MKTIIVYLLAAVCAVLAVQPIQLHYHEHVGIPEARRIQQAEQLRVAGGSEAPAGKHPYLAGLLVSLSIGATSVCGSSIISNSKLLTAAHCWFDGLHQGTEVTAVLGSTTLFSGGTRLASSQVEVHGSYNPSNLNNDIAIITVSAIQYTNTIRPITLPSSFLLWLTFEYNLAQVVGYGVTRDDENITSNQIQREVTAMVVNNLDCQTVYGFNVIHSTICTSGQGAVGPCGGDSGGPLVATISGEPIIIGVVSFHAAGGCNIGFPGGYARVTSFATWINQRL